MVSEFSVELFSKCSRNLQEFFGIRNGPVDPLDVLVLHGPGEFAEELVNWSEQIHSAQPDNPEPVTFRGWKDHPQADLSFPTAHECAAVAIYQIWANVFPDLTIVGKSGQDPDSFWQEVSEYRASRANETTRRWNYIVENSDNNEWMRLAARMRIELAHVVQKYSSTKTKPPSAKDASRDYLAAVLLRHHFDGLTRIDAAGGLGFDQVIALATNKGRIPRGFTKGNLTKLFNKLFDGGGHTKYLDMVQRRAPELRGILTNCGLALREHTDGNELADAAEKTNGRGRVKSSARAVHQRTTFDSNAD